MPKITPKSGSRILNSVCVKRVSSGDGEVVVVPYEDAASKWYGLFYISADGAIYDVMRGFDGTSPEGWPVRFKHLSGVAKWYEDNLPLPRRFCVSMQSLSEYRRSNPDLFDPTGVLDPSSIDSERYDRIKRALALKGVSIRSLAEKLDVSHTALMDVCRRTRSNDRVEHGVAMELGMSVNDLFYSADGYLELATS